VGRGPGKAEREDRREGEGPAFRRRMGGPTETGWLLSPRREVPVEHDEARALVASILSCSRIWPAFFSSSTCSFTNHPSISVVA